MIPKYAKGQGVIFRVSQSAPAGGGKILNTITEGSCISYDIEGAGGAVWRVREEWIVGTDGYIER